MLPPTLMPALKRRGLSTLASPVAPAFDTPAALDAHAAEHSLSASAYTTLYLEAYVAALAY